jgi:hypothetical protein
LRLEGLARDAERLRRGVDLAAAPAQRDLDHLSNPPVVME